MTIKLNQTLNERLTQVRNHKYIIVLCCISNNDVVGIMMHSPSILISTPRIKLSIDRRSSLIRTIKNKKNTVEALVELSMVISNKTLLQMITRSEGLHRKERITIH